MYIVPDEKKEELRKPLGKITKKIRKENLKGKIVSVGDMVTMSLEKEGIKPDIAVVDYRIERKEYERKDFSAEKIIKVKNPASKITRELWNAIATAYIENKKVLIEVDGEEDLAALPAIYLAPDNTTVIYGMPSKGMVVVNVGRKERDKVEKFLKNLEG
ncbi:MAG: DUF359 domain-containing protein [Thermoplasmatales archaeon]|nr:DUF359 domain-containing protein [Thermoplasmatales archaeon]